MFSFLRQVLGWILRSIGSRKDLVLENLALREQLLVLHAKRIVRSTQAVLGRLEKALVWMAEAAGPGDATNGSRVASGQRPAVLEMALPKSAKRRTPGDPQRDS